MRRMQAAGVDAFGGQVHLLELEAPGSPAPDENPTTIVPGDRVTHLVYDITR